MQSPDVITAVAPIAAQLRRLGVRYYLGGSVASSAYGRSRATQDADLVADLHARHVAPLVTALQGTYYVSEPAVADAVARKSCFNAIHLATMFKVDVFALKTRPYDRTAMDRIQERLLDKDDPSAHFFLASAEDVVLSKLEWFRLGDEVSENQWRDVLGVLKVQERNLDRAYLAKWAADLGVADLLERAWNEAEGKNQ